MKGRWKGKRTTLLNYHRHFIVSIQRIFRQDSSFYPAPKSLETPLAGDEDIKPVEFLTQKPVLRRSTRRMQFFQKASRLFLSAEFRLVFLPLLLGIAVFGVYKSVKLSKENNGLRFELVQANSYAAESRRRMHTAEEKNEILLDDLADLKKKLELKEAEAREQLKNIALLTQKFQETAVAYAHLAKDAQKRSDDYIVLAFENADLKAKLAEVKGLKRQIRKIEHRNKKTLSSSRKMAAPAPQRNTAPSCLAEAIGLAIGAGNEGYIVKEGEPTYSKKIEITVDPAPR